MLKVRLHCTEHKNPTTKVIRPFDFFKHIYNCMKQSVFELRTIKLNGLASRKSDLIFFFNITERLGKKLAP